MRYWITKDGIYYESEFKIHSDDTPISKRPHQGCSYINGIWVCPPSNHVDVGDQYKNEPPIYQERKSNFVQPEKRDNNIVLSNEGTKLLFGVKDILIIVSFIVTATISWQDTDSRISKTEDKVSQLEIKQKTLENDVKNLEKQLKEEQQKIEQHIRELEQVIFMKNSLKIKE